MFLTMHACMHAEPTEIIFCLLIVPFGVKVHRVTILISESYLGV